jgi:hypothetical protein
MHVAPIRPADHVKAVSDLQFPRRLCWQETDSSVLAGLRAGTVAECRNALGQLSESTFHCLAEVNTRFMIR